MKKLEIGDLFYYSPLERLFDPKIPIQSKCLWYVYDMDDLFYYSVDIISGTKATDSKTFFYKTNYNVIYAKK